jgi:hypothetical protein
MSKQPTINIIARAKHNAYSLALIGMTSLALVLIMMSKYWLEAKLVLILLLLVSLILVFIGITKILEPVSSFSLTPSYLRYQHKYGQWQLPWHDIVDIRQISESVWLEQINLPYVGIRLHQLTALIDNMSPRLASRLIHEHRPLIIFCVQHKLIEFEQGIINFSPFTLEKKAITGPRAAFLHQMMILKGALGYHLYLPESALDRDCQAFCQLLKSCQQNAKNYSQLHDDPTND